MYAAQLYLFKHLFFRTFKHLNHTEHSQTSRIEVYYASCHSQNIINGRLKAVG